MEQICDGNDEKLIHYFVLLLVKTTYLSRDRLPVVEEVEPLLPAVLVLDLRHPPLVLAVQHDVDVGVAAKVEAEEALEKKEERSK